MPEAAICPACRTSRLLRRYDPLCPACIQAARQPVRRPLWLFDSPALRNALAQVNLPAVPAIVRAATDLSQADLAAIAGWSPSTLGLYAHGHRDGIFDIRVFLQFADAVDMPREVLLPLLLGSAGGALVPDIDLDDAGMELNRRDFASLAAAATTATVLPEIVVPRSIGMPHVRYLQRCADGLWSRDQAIGGAALLRSGLRHWHRACRMLKESSFTETVGRELLGATGRLGVCVGWLAFDSGQHNLARTLYTEAQTLAEQSADPVLSTHVLEKSSLLASSTAQTSGAAGAARNGLLLAHRAAEEARYEPLPRLHTLIALRQAYAASLIGDKVAFRSGINRAQRELDRGSQSEVPEWLRFVDEAEIAGHEAMGYLHLGEPHHSEELYRDLLEGNLSPRNRVYYAAGLASALLRQGDVEQAITEGQALLPALVNGITSIRTIGKLRPLRAAARRTGAEEFCHGFDETERELMTLHPAC